MYLVCIFIFEQFFCFIYRFIGEILVNWVQVDFVYGIEELEFLVISMVVLDRCVWVSCVNVYVCMIGGFLFLFIIVYCVDEFFYFRKI